MEYSAVLSKEGQDTLAEFPDCPGCQTFAGPDEDIAVLAAEALEGWLESMLEARDRISPPTKVKAAKGAKVLKVPVPAKLAAMLQLKWAREASGWTQAQLAQKTGVSQQQIAKLERPDSNPTIETLEKVARALGFRYVPTFVKLPQGA